MNSGSTPAASQEPEPEVKDDTSTTMKPRKFAPEPVETSTKSSRRFVPQPVESSSRSSKEERSQAAEDVTKDDDKKADVVAPKPRKVRRFTPQLVEETTRSSTPPRQASIDYKEISFLSQFMSPAEISKMIGWSAPPLPEGDKKSEASGADDADTSRSGSPTIKRRKFAVEPVETTTKSSKKQQEPLSDTAAATTAQDENQYPSPENAKAPRRRFAPQAVESTTRNSKAEREAGQVTHNDEHPAVEEKNEDIVKPTRRRFAPEPVESTSKSSRTGRQQDPSIRLDMLEHPPDGHAKTSNGSSGSATPARRRFAPQLSEVSTKSSRVASRTNTVGSSTPTPASERAPLLSYEMDLGPPTPREPPARRKFAPQLIETAKRTRKSGDSDPAVLPGDKTNITPDDSSHDSSDDSTRSPRVRISIASQSRSGDSSPLRQITARNLRARKHSYRVPTLPDIDSSESEESRTVSICVSIREDSDTSDEIYKDATRRRESMDAESSGYLLEIAARAAEKQLRDQAAAAFVNSDYHEPVDHYVDRSDSEEELPAPPVLRSGRPATRDPTRRDSGDDKLAFKEMQRHGERLRKLELARQKSFSIQAARRRKEEASPSSTRNQLAGAGTKPKRMIGGNQRDPDLKQMRKAASPPMLGGDIDFPRCASPEHARFDVTQGADFLRKQMCYLTQQVDDEETPLWSKKSTQATKAGENLKLPGFADLTKGTWGSANSRPHTPGDKDKAGGGGLWGGFCTGQDARIPQMPSGLQTPQRTPSQTPNMEKDDPFSVMSVSSNAPAIPARRAPSILAGNPHFTASPGAHAAVSGTRTPARLPASPPQHGNPQNHTPPHLLPAGTRTPQAAIHPPHPNLKHTAQQASFAAAIDARFALEAKIDAEFNDALVTQVYNYLSLGYPSLARKYDEELSRICRVPVDELRSDDKLGEVWNQPKGHVRLSEDGDWDEDDHEGGGGKGRKMVDPRNCKRWRALRRYVREWGRQMIKKEGVEGAEGRGLVDPHLAWGLPARRGSWGL